MSADDLRQVYHYHDETKHHFNRFARALGYLDWASQPRPFRSFAGAQSLDLFDGSDGTRGAGATAPLNAGSARTTSHSDAGGSISYDRLLSGPPIGARPIARNTVGDFLRHALGLSAWKVFHESRWALRVNPSSGNLHPTEAYLITGGRSDFDRAAGQGEDGGGVWHYAPDRHVIERRCEFAAGAWSALAIGEPDEAFLMALTSIHWREAWKYGERAFRYCQHDLGHAVAALSLSAALLGWRLTILPSWPHRAIATIAGLDREEDYVEAEREEPACLLLVSSSQQRQLPASADAFTEAVRSGRWSGRASQLSEDHVQWTFIDEVARATAEPAARPESAGNIKAPPEWSIEPAAAAVTAHGVSDRGLDARALFLQRRSALALDGMSSIGRAAFLRILARVMPAAAAPWNAMWWTPRIHLVLFVHRVDGLAPGLYLLPRSPAALPALRAALSGAFLWERAADSPPLWLLERGEFRARSTRVSCDQTIAADGFFSLGMIAEFDLSLREQGASFYRQLFWEAGIVGQVLYLEAEAAAARGTGIGCFYDDAVHEMLGLRDHAFQSLYHFTVGAAVEDTRLTTEPGY